LFIILAHICRVSADFNTRNALTDQYLRATVKP
jgi:hypothetical protein